MVRLVALVVLFVSSMAHAADRKLGLANESALGYVVTGGNSEAETSSIKHSSTYNWEKDTLKFDGHYLQSSGQVEVNGQNETQTTAENWSATARYEKVITPKWFKAFIAHGWYGDLFQGVRHGHATDIGAKYYTANSESYKHFIELGYRYTKELFRTAPLEADKVGVGSLINPEYHYARLFTQFDYQHNKGLALGLWIEYLPSITDFSNDQRLNFSPYLTSVLTDMFSLKVSYEGRYRDRPANPTFKMLDFTFTTALIAKF